MNQRIPVTEVLILLAAATGVQLLCSLYWPAALLIDLPLIVTLYIGWCTTPINGALWGSVFGLMSDITGLLPYWGLNGFSKTLLGSTASFLSRWVVLEGFPARVVMIGGLALTDRILLAWFLDLFGQPRAPNTLQLALVYAVLTGLAGAVFFRLYDRYRFPEKDFTKLE